jgi:hypothetical protein
MSLHTDDALEGFAELLEAVGIDLHYGGESFRAVLSTEQPSNEPYDLTPGDDQSVQVSAFASAFMTTPAIGDYFEDDTGNQYRIKSRRLRPGQSIIRFSCEVSEL